MHFGGHFQNLHVAFLRLPFSPNQTLRLLGTGRWVLLVGTKLTLNKGYILCLKKKIKTNQQKTSVILGKTLPDAFGCEYVSLVTPFHLLKMVSLSRQPEQD